MKAKLTPKQSSSKGLTKNVHWMTSRLKKTDDTQPTANHRHQILSAVINTIPNPAFYKDAAGVFIDCNKAFAKTILGTMRKNIVGHSVHELLEFIPKALVDICTQHDEKLLKTPGLQAFEISLSCADGVQRDFLLSQATLTDDRRAVFGIVGVMLDLTDTNRAEKLLNDRTAELIKSNQELKRQIRKRKIAKKTIREAHREIDHLISSLPTILIGLSTRNEIIHWNAIAEKVLGKAAKDIIGLPLNNCGLEWDCDKIADGIAQSQREGCSTRVDDILFKNAHGEDRFLGITIKPLNGGNDSSLGTTIIGADITDRKKMEAQLNQSHKMEAIGQLAAGIAHEINTPTQFVGDNTRFLQDAFDDLIEAAGLSRELIEALKSKSAPVELIDEVEKRIADLDLAYLEEEIPLAIQHTLKGVDRITHIVQAMKIFAHPGGIEKETIDINKEIEKTLIITRNEWKYVAELATDFDSALPSVPCHRAEFNQVILNLIVNAAHAIADSKGKNPSEKGTITIRTAQVENWVEIRISDTGPGIPEEIRHRIFDLFFTTKEPGKGTGQGLAIAHSVIAEKHDGTLDLESEEGKGTTFVIRLPIEAELSENE